MDLVMDQNPQSLKIINGRKTWLCSGIAKVWRRFSSLWVKYRSFICQKQDIC
jgi:hypothetical protein